MMDLDQLTEVRRLDSQNFLDRILKFPHQFEEASRGGCGFSGKLVGPGDIASVVLAGVGGSAIGAEFVRSRLIYLARVPICVFRHYRLPAFVNSKTLMIASSYSGNTEETVQAVEEGIAQKANIVVITSGGKLQELAREKGLALIKVPQGYPPRMAIGFSISSILSVLETLGIAPSFQSELEETAGLLKQLAQDQYQIEIPEAKNPAKRLARALLGKFPLIYASSDYMEAVALRWREQLEENAKTLSGHFLFPEMTHNEIVGWCHPRDLLNRFTAVFLVDSKQDHERIQYRFQFAEEVIRGAQAEVIRLEACGQSPFARMFSLAYLSDFVSFYLAMLNEVDPTSIQVIDQLKKELSKK